MEEIEQTGQDENKEQPLPEEEIVAEAKPVPEKEAAAKTGSVPVETEDEAASAREGSTSLVSIDEYLADAHATQTEMRRRKAETESEG